MSTMTDEEMRIAIAKACGMSAPFQVVREWEETGGIDGYDGWFNVLRDSNSAKVPDYLNSIDAMHEAEKVLTALEQQQTYASNLRSLTEPQASDPYSQRFLLIHATARQRALAFLQAINFGNK